MKIKLVKIRLCEACLEGRGDECHTPECALCFHSSPGYPIHREMYEVLDEWENGEPNLGYALKTPPRTA